jgi:GPH family glycoside/pentoside/hexuronide:cation symporter
MNELKQIERSKSTTGKMITFSFPRFGSSLVLGIEGLALFTLYSYAYGVHPFLAAFAQAMGYLAIAAAQFSLGWVSDAKYTRWGRRKPYVLVFAPLLGISFIFLLLPGLVLPDMQDKNALFMWMLVWDILFRISYAVTTPYQAWMAEQFEVNERPKVSQFQNTFNWIGNGLMAIVTMVILTQVFAKITAEPNVIPTEFLIITLLFGIIVTASFLLAIFLIPTEPKYEIKTNLIESLKIIVKNKNYMRVVLMQGISGFAWAIATTLMLKYTLVVLALGTMDYLIVAIFLLLGIFGFLYIWRKLIEKKGKKQVLLYIFLFAVITFPITLLGLIPMDSYLILGIFFILVIALTLAGWFLFPYIMYADLAEDDEKKTGDLKAGIYIGFPSIILNIFQAVGLLVIGLITSLPDITVGPSTYSIGLVIWGPICSVILLVSYFYTKKYVTLDFDWEKTE